MPARVTPSSKSFTHLIKKSVRQNGLRKGGINESQNRIVSFYFYLSHHVGRLNASAKAALF
jgi:hypothetical protein